MIAYKFDFNSVKKVPSSVRGEKAMLDAEEVWVLSRDSNYVTRARVTKVKGGGVRLSLGAGGIFMTRVKDAREEGVNLLHSSDKVYVGKGRAKREYRKKK